MVRFIASLSTIFFSFSVVSSLPAGEAPRTLAQLVEPSTVFYNGDEKVLFALHGFIEFDNLEALFPFIDEQAGRWQFDSDQQRKAFADNLLRRGLESRVISMTYERPHEILVTHTAEELADAVQAVRTSNSGAIFQGRNWRLDAATYTDVLLQLQQRWKSSVNCWSASSSVAGRVLSNWYIIEEGITLFGADYDSTEHFWQAVKYHPDVRLADLKEVIGRLRSVPWDQWVDELSNDQAVYMEHGYAVEFLRHNLSAARLEWFADQVSDHAARFDVGVRRLQQRDPAGLRFTALDEKVLWGDLADVFHLVYFFAHLDNGRFNRADMAAVLRALSRHHFDGIYLSGYQGGRVAFISPEFRQLMLEIWKVKFLEMKRFREVISSTRGTRLLHFLNDGDSPDIPIRIYVRMLEQIRVLALQ